MLEAPVAFVAHSLDHFRISRQFGADGDGPRLRVGTRTRERHLDLEVAEVAAAVAFGRAQTFRVWMAIVIEPRAIVEAEAFHDECVASQCPTEYPIQLGLGADSSLRPSRKIWRYVRSGLRMRMSPGVWTIFVISAPVLSADVA
jgi:hypothetical protein